MLRLWLCLCVLSWLPAAEARIAVAANFAEAARALAQAFAAQGGGAVELVLGSTGKLTAQIHAGAPYDAFFAADTRRPQLLIDAGLAPADSYFIYARGRLALWTAQAGLVDGADILRQSSWQHLAIANPRLAPYGAAAQAYLQSLGLWQQLQPRLVQGQSIGQCFQFVHSGNAELGLVAWSQLCKPDTPVPGSYFLPDLSSYPAIAQAAVALNDHQTAHGFLRFVRQSVAAQVILRAYGYEVSDDAAAR